MFSSNLPIWYDRRNSTKMCFANSAYILIHSNIMKTFPSVNVEIMTIDHIATSCGFTNETGVTLSEGRIQNLVRKVTDSLRKLGHHEIDFALTLETEPNLTEIDSRLDSGEIILAAFSTGIYNRYFQKTGRRRPCVETFEEIGLDRLPPHYVSLVGIDEGTIGILDPLCKYKIRKRPMKRSDFLDDNANLIEKMPRIEFYQKILLNNRMDGIDFLNRELIYSNVILNQDEEGTTNKGKGKTNKKRSSSSLDTFFSIEEKNDSDSREGGNLAK